MSTTQNHDDVTVDTDIVARLSTPTSDNAQAIYDTLTRAWGMPEVPIERGRTGVPISTIQDRLLKSDTQYGDDPETETRAQRSYGHRSPFAAAAAVGTEYDEEDAHSAPIEQVLETQDALPDGERAIIDNNVVQAVSPIVVDPRLVDVQRSAAPVLDVIQAQAQPGFTAEYNVVDSRNDPIGMVSESEAAGDISSFTDGDFGLTQDSKDMKIYLDQATISDFSQRAEATLEYMDLTQTTLGQRTIAHALFKAKQIFYGDPSVAAGDKSVEDGDAYEGLAKIASDASNVKDKTGTTSGRLEDMLDEVTSLVEDTGLTFDRAGYLVSPSFYNKVYDEVTPVVRLDGYDANVEYGPRGLAIATDQGTVNITTCPNIRDYSSELSGVGSNSTNGDVFLIDEMAVQFRQLAPFSTLPLGRTGLADKVAMFEYGTLIDKSQGNHTLRLRYGAV